MNTMHTMGSKHVFEKKRDNKTTSLIISLTQAKVTEVSIINHKFSSRGFEVSNAHNMHLYPSHDALICLEVIHPPILEHNHFKPNLRHVNSVGML